MNFSQRIPFETLMEPVALRLLGEPNKALSKYPTDMRWGTHGSLSVNFETGEFYDHENNEGGGVIDFLIKYKRGDDHAGAMSWLRREGMLNGSAPRQPPARPQRAANRSTIIATYDYHDENDNVIFQVVRFEPKDFRQRRPDGKGGWIWDLKGVRRVLYHLSQLIAATQKRTPVFLVEGEKDADSLAGFGFIATTNPGGANKWRDEYTDALRGASVIVIPDHDDAGREHVDKIIASLSGVAQRIRVLDLKAAWPGCPDKGDISNWIEAGGTRDQLNTLVRALPDWLPVAPPNSDGGKSEPWRDGMISARELCTMHFAPLKFAVPKIIPEGLTILAGRPKIGKSWLVLLLGVVLANGVAALGLDYGNAKPLKGSVLYLGLEDGRRRLQRRMTKLIGALSENWPEQLYLKTDWRRFDQGGLEDIRAWHDSARAKGETPVLVIVDTLAKVRAVGNSKTSPYQNDHDALAGLQKLAEELGLSIVVNHHDRKMDADDVFDTVSGTLGLTGAVDTILVLARKAQGTTLHIRGRDIEDETALAMQFNKETCRWSVLGTVAAQDEVHRSEERVRILTVLKSAPDGLSVPEIIMAAQLRNRNAADILLFKMKGGGEIANPRRGIYCLPEHAGKIGKKERLAAQPSENKDQGADLSGLSEGANLSAGGNGHATEPEHRRPAEDFDLGIPPFLRRENPGAEGLREIRHPAISSGPDDNLDDLAT